LLQKCQFYTKQNKKEHFQSDDVSAKMRSRKKQDQGSISKELDPWEDKRAVY